MRIRSTSAMVLVFLLLGVAQAGCNEGDALTGVVPATPAFDPDAIPPGLEGHVSLRVGSVDGSTIELDVVVTEVDDPVGAIALNLTYPNDFSRFTSCADGELFPPGACSFAESAPGSGEVFVGRTVTGARNATPVSGEQVIVRLRFLVFGVSDCTDPEECRIGIEGQNLGGSGTALLGPDKEPIVVQWFSGILRGE